jgi:hypothetical protein
MSGTTKSIKRFNIGFTSSQAVVPEGLVDAEADRRFPVPTAGV